MDSPQKEIATQLQHLELMEYTRRDNFTHFAVMLNERIVTDHDK
jgi:hypothetical protein